MMNDGVRQHGDPSSPISALPAHYAASETDNVCVMGPEHAANDSKHSKWTITNRRIADARLAVGAVTRR
jgi:hypothetical protein